jgi:hypothetical protein
MDEMRKHSTGYFRYVTLKSEIRREGALVRYGWIMGWSDETAGEGICEAF